jgi:hypothetical protein
MATLRQSKIESQQSSISVKFRVGIIKSVKNYIYVICKTLTIKIVTNKLFLNHNRYGYSFGKIILTHIIHLVSKIENVFITIWVLNIFWFNLLSLHFSEEFKSYAL